MKWTWKLLTGEDIEYSINAFVGTESLLVDGEKQKLKNKLFGGRHEVPLKDGRSVVLITKPNFGLAPGVQLFVGDKEINPNNGPAKRHPPGWVWTFVVICMVIPIITVGGAVPAAIGVSGALGCISVSRSKLAAGMRVFLCIVVSSTTWLVFVWLMRLLK